MTCSHTNIMKLLYYITHSEHFITLAHLFCKWKFVFLILPHLFLFSPNSSLWQSPVSSLYVWNCFLSFSIWLISLRTIFSRSTHIVENNKILYLYISFFLWQSNIYVSNIFLNHSSIDRHVGCFHISVIVNKAAMNIGMHISFKLLVFIFFR